MTPFASFTWHAAVAGRWTARILGSLMVLFLLAFLIGEGVPSWRHMTAQERLYALGVCALFLGLVVAWFREAWGGLLSLAGWGWLIVLARRPAWDLLFSLPAALGAIHLLCGWRLRGPAPPPGPAAGPAGPGRRWMVRSLWAALAVFLLLCANEIFGEPPFMTPATPPAAWVGTWHATLTVLARPLPGGLPVVLTIAPDGSVSGTVGGATLTSGRFAANRSWFGRLMHWRTEYGMRGTLSQVVEYGGAQGARFAAPLSPTAAGLDGALFLSEPGIPRPLGLRLRR